MRSTSARIAKLALEDHEGRRMSEPIQVLCGDAVDVLRTLAARSIVLTVSSPPYFRHRDYGVRGQIGRESSLGLYLENIQRVLAEIFRVTDDAGSCFLVVGDSYIQRRLLLVPHRIAIGA